MIKFNSISFFADKEGQKVDEAAEVETNPEDTANATSAKPGRVWSRSRLNKSKLLLKQQHVNKMLTMNECTSGSNKMRLIKPNPRWI
jgi:hypothetical protein